MASVYPDRELPTHFVLPALPVAVESWFEVGAQRTEDTEAIAYGENLDGAVLDDYGVVDAASARLALIGYRWVWEGGDWVDDAARGRWNPDWIVLDAINADPIIADVSTPEVRVLQARHGEGEWKPEPLADSLAAFIAELELNDDPGPPPMDDTFDEWAVWARDLGPSPLKTLVAISGHPLFPDYTREQLLALRDELPVVLVERATETIARACVEVGARHGAVLEMRRSA